MSKITQVQQDNKTGRVLVYIDYRFCASVRPDIWKVMGLQDGDEITYARLRQKERELYKKARRLSYNDSSKQALSRIVHWFNKYIVTLDTKIVDFNFEHSNGNYFGYPTVRYDQNISLFIKNTNIELVTLEVATTEVQKGIDHWVDANKIAYAKSQAKRDSWVVLYYRYPAEKLIWIKPDSKVIYSAEEFVRGPKKQFIRFKKGSPEIYPSPKFFNYIQDKIVNQSSEVLCKGDVVNVTAAKNLKVHLDSKPK